MIRKLFLMLLFIFISSSAISQTMPLQLIGLKHDFILSAMIKEYGLFENDYLHSEFTVNNGLHYSFWYDHSDICWAFSVKTVEEESKTVILKLLLSDGYLIGATKDEGMLFKYGEYYVLNKDYGKMTEFTFSKNNTWQLK